MSIIVELLLKEEALLLEKLEEVRKELAHQGVYSSSSNVQVNNIVNSISKDLDLKDKPLQTQALEVLKSANRFLHKFEIAEVLKPYHRDLSEKKLDMKLALELGKAKSKGIITNVQYAKSSQAFVWGSNKWIDETGKIKLEHTFVEKEKTIPMEF